MTNADKIRKMSDEQLARFLWVWKINSVTAFLTQGGMNSMNAKDMREWVGHPVDTFVCTETFVGDEYIFDQDFNTKADRKTENSSEKPNNSTISKMEQVEPQTCSFSDCDNFKNPDYARCIKCKRKQIMLKDEPQTEREGE